MIIEWVIVNQIWKWNCFIFNVWNRRSPLTNFLSITQFRLQTQHTFIYLWDFCVEKKILKIAYMRIIVYSTWPWENQHRINWFIHNDIFITHMYRLDLLRYTKNNLIDSSLISFIFLIELLTMIDEDYDGRKMRAYWYSNIVYDRFYYKLFKIWFYSLNKSTNAKNSITLFLKLIPNLNLYLKVQLPHLKLLKDLFLS